jgi:AcrR family transcriptional regulator
VAAIVDAAARILPERVWSGFNTNAIAVRAGVSVGSLYEYFPDKQALLDRLLQGHLAEAEAQLSAAEAEAALDGHVPDPAVAARLLVDTIDAVVHRRCAHHAGTPLPTEALTAELERMLGGYLAALALARPPGLR